MDYFRKKYSNPLFMIVSDDPGWCDTYLKANDTFVVRGNSPEQDLAILAACNHSIFDYGTFGMWGAMMAGGETLANDNGAVLEHTMLKMMPNWRAVT